MENVRLESQNMSKTELFQLKKAAAKYPVAIWQMKHIIKCKSVLWNDDDENRERFITHTNT